MFTNVQQLVDNGHLVCIDAQNVCILVTISMRCDSWHSIGTKEGNLKKRLTDGQTNKEKKVDLSQDNYSGCDRSFYISGFTYPVF